MGFMKFQDVRHVPRVDAVFKVAFEDLNGIFDYTENFSEDGVFIATEKEFQPGARLMFMVSFPGLVQPIPLMGEVVWRRVPHSLQNLQPPGIGVLLKFKSELERAWLRDLIGRLVAPRPAQVCLPAEPFVVLLAEDNATIRALFEQALGEYVDGGSLPAEFLETEGALQTLKILKQRRVDLLLIEWRLCLDGEIIKQIRSQAAMSSIPVVVIGSRREEADEALSAGADVFVKRPIPAKGLVRVVQALIRERHPIVYA